MPMLSFGQVGNYSIVGESLWRNQGYGVENHFFQIENYVIPVDDSWYVDPDLETGDCPYEFYTTEEMPLYNVNLSALANTLKIRPYSINNAADYRNGVSTLDLVAIENHLISSPAFESRTPTEDFPFRYISGDADYDHDVDEDDIDMIHDLILFYRDDLTRKSWEWVHKDEVEEAEERFEEEPYEFVIDYNWPGSEGIILSALSTNQINGDNDKYFTFRTTKVGDITASSMTAVSYNDWVCGTGAYFTGGGLSSRSAGVVSIGKGSTLRVSIWLDNQEDIYGLEIPMYFSEIDLSLSELTFEGDFKMRWHRNSSHHSLVFSDFSRDGKPMLVPEGKIINLELKANSDIDDFKKAMSIYPSRFIEVIGYDEELLYPQVRIELDEIILPEFYTEIRSDEQENDFIFINAKSDHWIHLNICSATGQTLKSEVILVNRGQSWIELPLDYSPGLYICSFKGSDSGALKWIKR